MTVDPILDIEAALADPRRWNRYVYVLNNPFAFADPSGAAIELLGDENQRAQAFDAICASVGTQACSYLYQQKINGRYYVGVYSGGPSGGGRDFEDLNPIAARYAKVIDDRRVLQLAVAPAGSTVTALDGATGLVGPVGSGPGGNGSPGLTFTNKAGIMETVLLDTRTGAYGALYGDTMSDRHPGSLDGGLILTHELGHVLHSWSWLARLTEYSNDSAVRVENELRQYRNPAGPTRVRHDPRFITQ
jgi:hypothetical protein